MTLQAELLGRFSLLVHGKPVPAAAFTRPSGLRLLKLLLSTPGHRVRREAAAEALWPEADRLRSGANVRKAICFARRALIDAGAPGGTIETDGPIVAIGASLVVQVDADRLRAVIRRTLDARAAQRPVEPGDLATLAALAGPDLLPDEPDQEWLLPLRERLHRDVVEALMFAAEHARRSGSAGLAAQLVARLLEYEPADEMGHRLAIELHLDAGRVDAARRQLFLCAAALADFYGVQPSGDLQGLIATARRPKLPASAGTADASIGRVLVDALAQAIAAVSPASIAGGAVATPQELIRATFAR